MPLLTIRTNAKVAEEKVEPLLRDCSQKLSAWMGKPEAYVMTAFEPVGHMTLGASAAPCCLLEVRAMGQMGPKLTARLSQGLSELMHQHLGVEPARVFINFADVQGAYWGFDGGTLG